jgi:hypothetical protein
MRAIVCCSLIFFDTNLQVYFSGQTYFPSPTPLPLMVALPPIPAPVRVRALCGQEAAPGRLEGPHRQGPGARLGRNKRRRLTLHCTTPDLFQGQVDLALSNPMRDEKGKNSMMWYGIWHGAGLCSHYGGKIVFSSKLMSKLR